MFHNNNKLSVKCTMKLFVISYSRAKLALGLVTAALLGVGLCITVVVGEPTVHSYNNYEIGKPEMRTKCVG